LEQTGRGARRSKGRSPTPPPSPEGSGIGEIRKRRQWLEWCRPRGLGRVPRGPSYREAKGGPIRLAAVL